MKRFSIITVNYNNAKGLENTIKSVLTQTCKDFEFIIIDGGSIDSSKEIIEKYSQDIDYWVSEKDNGVYEAMNKGIRMAKGTYLNFMNSGDIFYDENVLETIANSNCQTDLIIGKDLHINEQGGRHTTIFPLQMGMYTFYKSYLPHQATFFKKELFSNRMYDEKMRIASDWKFYIESICEDGATIQTIDTIVCSREQDGISCQYAQRSQEERKQVLQEKLPQGVLNDYQILDNLDFHTVQKFLHIIQNPKGRRYTTLFIKVLFRLLGNKGMTKR